jgi:GNAT superfamily N-acetyltransferase
MRKEQDDTPSGHTVPCRLSRGAWVRWSRETAMRTSITVVREDDQVYGALVRLAERLGQARYIPVYEPNIDESLLLGAFVEQACVGFLRLLIQVIGSDIGRIPILRGSTSLREGYVEAFGVAPEHRRQGIGQMLQEAAIDRCRERGCYQIRSRSPITSQENYALKLKMGYAIHPSHENESYYFIKTLADPGSTG